MLSPTSPPTLSSPFTPAAAKDPVIALRLLAPTRPPTFPFPATVPETWELLIVLYWPSPTNPPTSLKPVIVTPNRPTDCWVGLLMVRLEIVWPRPSRVPVKVFTPEPMGLNPAPEFQPDVA